MVTRKHVGRVVVGGMVAALCVLLVGTLVVLPGCGASAGDAHPAGGVDVGVDKGVPLTSVGEKRADVVSWDSGEVTGSVAPGEVHRYKFHTHQGFFYTVELSSRMGDGTFDGGDNSDLFIGRTTAMDVTDPGTYWRSETNGGLIPDSMVFKSALEHAMYVTVLGVTDTGPAGAKDGEGCEYRLRVDRSTATHDWDLSD